MRAKIGRIEEKIKTKEDLIFFLHQIDLAYDLVLKNPEKEVKKILEGKIHPDLFLVLKEIEKENEKQEIEKFESEKRELSKKESEIKENLKFILEREKELEEEIEKIEKEETEFRGTEKEKILEKKRWELEEERIKIEKEKWEMKENLEKIRENLKRNKPEKKDQTSLIFFLEELRKDLISLPEINLEIALEPRLESISQIEKWLKENLERKVILNFKIDPKIVGGAIVEYKGRVLDFSLIKEIKKEIQKIKNGNYSKI